MGRNCGCTAPRSRASREYGIQGLRLALGKVQFDKLADFFVHAAEMASVAVTQSAVLAALNNTASASAYPARLNVSVYPRISLVIS